MEKDRRARLANQQRLRALRQRGDAAVALFCAHDRHAFESLAGRAIEAPATRAAPA